VAELIAACARIDLLVCNANIAPTFAPLSVMSWADFSEKVMGELAAVFHVTQKALEVMREQRSGQVVYVSSVVADLTMPNAISQATAKAALNTFARQVAAEAGHYGITVNTVSPGIVRTEASSVARTPEMEAAHAKNSVLSRITEPDDVAALITTIADGGFRAVSGAHPDRQRIPDIEQLDNAPIQPFAVSAVPDHQIVWTATVQCVGACWAR
jgi:3-oxoacyl-[acyl-carrier protein] reductase